MAVAITNGINVAKRPPVAEAMQTRTNVPQKLEAKIAAKQAPKETKQAVNNAFGNVPRTDRMKQRENTAKGFNTELPESVSKGSAALPKNKANPPAGDAKTPPAADAKAAPAEESTGAPPAMPQTMAAPQPKVKLAITEDTTAAKQTAETKAIPPVDPRVQGILDARIGKDKNVREKIDAEKTSYIIKAAQQHFDVQAKNGEAFDEISKFYLNMKAAAEVQHGFKEAEIPPEDAAKFLNKDAIDKNLKAAIDDRKIQEWMQEQSANSIENTIANDADIARLVDPHKQAGENYVNVLRRMQSDYLRSPEFADAVAKSATRDDAISLMTEGYKGLAELGMASKDILGVNNALVENIRAKYRPEAPKTVIDPNTNEAVKDADGNTIVTLTDGTTIALTPDGKAVADKLGNAYVYNANGSAKVDANNKFVQYDARAKAPFANYDGISYMLGGDGKGRSDAQGRPLAIDSNGSAPVALDINGKAVTDTAGNKLVFNADSGKAVSDPATGNQVVIDKTANAVVQAGADGKVVAAVNGDPYAVDQQTGKFVVDKDGRYVLISKENVAPGIVPGYVVDVNNSKVVVDPYNNGKPMVDPASGKTVVLDPKTNAPQLVPLDANGAPKLAQDGKNIFYSESGNTVVSSDGKVSDWLVNARGNYAKDVNGNYIGVDRRSGLAAAVDAKGAPVANANGQIPLWDPRAEGPMKTGDGTAGIVLDGSGYLMATTPDGSTIVDPGTNMPYLIDPGTKGTRTDPASGQLIQLDTKSNLPFEYNGMDGYKYLVDTKTNSAVVTEDGASVVIDDNSRTPYAVKPDGTVQKNLETGNVVVFNTDGKAAVDKSTGFNIEITANGKASIIDPSTKAPVATKDVNTGKYQLFNPDGSETVNPDTGNKIQMDMGIGHKVEIDPKTNTPIKDAAGNTVLVGPGNTPMKTPDGNTVVADKVSNLPIAVAPDGKIVVDPDSGMARVIDVKTGVPLTDPVTTASVVIDPKIGAPVQVDPDTGAPIKDPVTGLNIVADQSTGKQASGPGGEPVVIAPGARLPVYFDKENHTLTVFNLATGEPVTNPNTGATLIIDPDTGTTAQVKKDAAGKMLMVDNLGQPLNDGKGNILYVDPNTGRVVIQDAQGKLVDPVSLQAPQSVDPKSKVFQAPIFTGLPPRESPTRPTAPTAPKEDAPEATGNGETDVPPTQDPVDTQKPDNTTDALPGPSTNANNEFPGLAPIANEDWNRPGYIMSPEEREEFRNTFDLPDPPETDAFGITLNQPKRPGWDYAKYVETLPELRKQFPELANIPDEELVAIRNYTDRGSQAINTAMKTGKNLDKWRPQIKAIVSGMRMLEKLGYSFEGTVYRRASLTKAEIIERFGAEGNVWRTPEFMSTSEKPTYSSTTRPGPGRNVGITIEKAKGVAVSNVSRIPREKEVLIYPEGVQKTKTIQTIGDPDIEYPHTLVTSEYLGSSDFPQAFTAPETPEGNVASRSNSLEITPEPLPLETSPPTNDTVPQPPHTTPDTPAVPGDTTVNSAAAARWAKLGKAVSLAGSALDFGFGGLQVGFGGIQIADGIENKDNYAISAGVLNVTSGALGIASSVASAIGGTVAAAATPLAIAGVVIGGIAGIVDYAGTLDDDEEFVKELAKNYAPLGILNDNWEAEALAAHRKATSKYYPENYQA